MDLIESFSIDHTKIIPGIFLSRVDMIGSDFVTTYDIRLKRPNREPAIDVLAMHSLEHIIATYLRNDSEWKNEVIYWGPMGCCTGNYLLMQGDLESSDIVPLIKETFAFIANYDESEIPGCSAQECGNYMLNNLPMAKWEARKFLVEILNNIQPQNLVYP